MTFEQTIQAMYDHYPCLFQDRADCLNHLFCTIGNGTTWNNGELVDPTLQAPVHQLTNGKAKQYQQLTLRDQARIYLQTTECKPQCLQTINTEEYLKTIPDDRHHRKPRSQRWYFRKAGICTDYAQLFNVPTDIKPDWKSGIHECIQLLVEDGFPKEKFQNIL